MNILKYRGKTVKRDILFWISGLCLIKCIQSIQQNRGKNSAYKTPPFLQAESCILWHLKRKCFLLVSLALPFSQSPAVIIVICGAFLCFNPRHCDWHAHYSEASNADEEKNRLCWSGDKYSSLQPDALQSFQQRY